MEKRYQVFVSSTFVDLIDERRAIMQALLELDCIPAGMELFPASDDDAWTLIQRVIDDCDYYVVILAGRYGSVDASGVGYTEKEYDYAVSTGKPVLAFLHASPELLPAKFIDADRHLQDKLAAFRLKARKKLCRFWSSPQELGVAVTTSFVKLIKTHPAEGWVKARFVKTTEDAEKVALLLEQVRTLEKELDALRKLGVAETAGLAQGEDVINLRFIDSHRENLVEATWNEVFAVVGKACLDLPIDGMVRNALSLGLCPTWLGLADPKDVEMIKLQLICLGLIRIGYRASEAGASVIPGQSPSNHWELTDYGRAKLGQLVGKKRGEPPGEPLDKPVTGS